jgi:hypothetical protein
MTGLTGASKRILEAFDVALTERGPAVRAAIAPGLEADAVRAGFRAAGVEPSDEALVWWQHWNGPRADFHEHPLQILPGLEPLSLDASLLVYEQQRRLDSELVESWAGAKPDEFWPPRWIAIFGITTGGLVALDTAGEPEAPSAVRISVANEVGSPEYGEIVAPSLGTLILRATARLSQSPLGYDPERGWLPESARASLSPYEGFAGS